VRKIVVFISEDAYFIEMVEFEKVFSEN